LKESSDGETLMAVGIWFQIWGAAEEKARMQTQFSPLSFGKSFMKIHSVQPFPRTVVWYFCGERKKQKITKNKKQKKTKKHL